MKRRLYAALGAAAALLPVTVLATATPSPSPALSTVLAAAPGATYVEADTTAPGVFEGAFNAQQYIALGSTTNPSGVQATLDRDGFIAGYGRTWVQQSTQRALIEAVVAFAGGTGAKHWLTAAELADKADPSYKGPLTITGIDAYYGAHFANATNKTFFDEFAFVKGNDFYIVIAVSTADNLGTSAATQATAQYKFAPDYTVPPADWPEAHTSTSSSAFDLGSLFGRVIGLVLIASVVVVVVGLIRRSRRPSAATIPGGYAAMSAAPPGGVQLSPDRNYWWDGQAWKDASVDAPPSAQRSDDGAFWWDGATWRPVPRPPM